MRRQHVVGTLRPTVADAVTVRTGSRIYDALTATGTWEIVASPRDWENGTIEFDETHVADDGDSSPLDFINRLNDMMWRVGITELGLKGEIIVTVTGGEPALFRVIVENSEVTYQKANLAWNNPVTP